MSFGIEFKKCIIDIASSASPIAHVIVGSIVAYVIVPPLMFVIVFVVSPKASVIIPDRNMNIPENILCSWNSTASTINKIMIIISMFFLLPSEWIYFFLMASILPSPFVIVLSLVSTFLILVEKEQQQLRLK